MLVEIDRHTINTDHIVSIESPAGPEDQWTITFVTGKSVMVDAGGFYPDGLCGVVVPAPPGLVLVEAFMPVEGEANQSVRYRHTPVVAFRITIATDAPVPISLMGEARATEHRTYAVLSPNGECAGWAQVWPSLAAFEADCEQTVAKRHARSRDDAEEVASRPERGTASPSAVETEDDSIAELRAHILAEPIRPISSKALWRDWHTSTETIEAVLRGHSDLHARGAGYDPNWGWKWSPDGMQTARSEMTTPSSAEEFERALRFLNYAGHHFRRPATTNRKRSSYSWKHAAERIMGGYVSNGMLIAAAYALGFLVAKEPGSPNTWINLSERAISLDPGNGAT